jgi:protein-tyrosine phosphatase
VINFRDVGGLATSSGAFVRPDQLYRSGHLADLSDQEVKQIMGLDFAMVVDLRYVGERKADPSPWPGHYWTRIVTHGSERRSDAPHFVLLKSGTLTGDAVEHCYKELYSEMPFDPLNRHLFATAIRRIADSDGRILVHCTAGKDRTGILIALILHSLGVSRDAIIGEYMLSSRSPDLLGIKAKIITRAKQLYGHELSAAAVDMLLDVRQEYLETAFLAIERQFGSVDDYLNDAGADADVRAKLRERLLDQRNPRADGKTSHQS